MKSLKRKFLVGHTNLLGSCVPAVGAECGLFKVDCHELVPVNLVRNDDDGDGDHSDGDHGAQC